MEKEETKEVKALEYEEKLMIFASLIEAGTDTSRTSTTQLIAAAATYPEWAAKARAYLDDVCGANAERLPTLDDRPKLPYITAIVKEILRWRPFLPIGLPHMLAEDDEYNGWKLPAGTTVTWNAYGIALDEGHYIDAHAFKPERFLDEHIDDVKRGHHAFGAGTCEILKI